MEKTTLAFNDPINSGLIRTDLSDSDLNAILSVFEDDWTTYEMDGPDCSVRFTIDGCHGSFRIISCRMDYFDERCDNWMSVEVGNGFQDYLGYSLGEGMCLYFKKHTGKKLDDYVDLFDGLFDWDDDYDDEEDEEEEE